MDKLKYVLFVGLFSIFSFFSPSIVQAEVNITVSGNGAGSVSDVTVSNTTTTNVEQTNTGNIDNSVDTTANTGNNSASDNTGDTSITTGDINADSSTSTSLNQNHLDINSGNDTTTVTISNNGTDSVNTVGVSSSATTSVSVNNNANVENNLNGEASTGNNSASDNNGHVSIHTGNIDIESHATTSANVARIFVDSSLGDFNGTISNNGADSVNTLVFNPQSFTLITKNEQLFLVNLLTWDASTGDNVADDNLGTVSIITGSISLASEVINGPINDNIICVNSNHCPVPPEPPVPPVIPPSPPDVPGGGGGGGGGGGSSSSGSSSGDSGTGGAVAAATIGKVLGAAAGRILPATGSRLYLMAILASIIMFLTGVYLKFRQHNLALA